MLTSQIYDAFGVGSSTGSYAEPFGFGAQWGYYTDQETGLVLCTHRYYDPGAGRFLTRDPIGAAGGINLYGYTTNEPVVRQDPGGLDPPSYLPVPYEPWPMPTPWPLYPPDPWSSQSCPITLDPGQIIWRYGDPGGHWFTDPGVGPGEISLPPNNSGWLNPPTEYEVLQPTPVDSGLTAPWGFSPIDYTANSGMGIQYQSQLSASELEGAGNITPIGLGEGAATGALLVGVLVIIAL